MNNFMKHFLACGLCILTFMCCNGSPLSPSIPFEDIERQLKESVNEKGFVPLNEFLVFFDTAKIPAAMRKIIDDIQITVPDIHVTTSSFALKGMAKLKNLVVSIDIGFKAAAGKPEGHISIVLPIGAKVSDFIPDFQKLDVIQFEAIEFVISNAAYIDSETNNPVQPGLTFMAGINFDTLLDKVRNKINKNISKDEFKKSIVKFFVTEGLGIRVYAHIPPEFVNVVAYVEIPIEFGVDFEALKKKNGEPVFKKPFIKKLTSSSIQAEIRLKELQPEVSISTGFFVYLKTQEKPLEFRGEGKITQSGVEFGGMMIGAYDPAFGLDFLSFGSFDPAVPPMVFSLYFDYILTGAAMAVSGIPLPTGITLAGALGLGRPPYRMTGSSLIRVTIESASISDFLISGKIDQIDLSRFIQILSGIGKKPLAIGKDIPIIKFSDLELTVVPLPTEVFGVHYDAGLKAGARVQIGKFDGSAQLVLGLTPENPRFMVEAKMDPVEIKTKKGLLIFSLTGYETPNPMFLIDLAVGRPLDKQKIQLDGALKIPPITYEGNINFNMVGPNLFGSGEGSFLDGKFTAKTDLNFDVKHPDKFAFNCLVHNDVVPWLTEQLKNGFEEFKKKSAEDLKKYQQQIDKIKENLREKMAQELVRVKRRINEIKAELKTLVVPEVITLKPALGNNIHISNHTDKKLYASFYIVNEKTKESEKRGKTVELLRYTKNQITRPKLALAKQTKYDRVIAISENPADLKDRLSKNEYERLTSQKMGAVFLILHIAKKDNRYKTYTGIEWDFGPGAKIIKLGSELAGLKSYRNALLKPGAKIADVTLEAVENLKKVPEAFVKFTGKMVNALNTVLNLIVLHEAKIVASGADLKEGKLPSFSLNFDIKPPKGKLHTFKIDLNIDLKKPLKFFVSLAERIARQMLKAKKDDSAVEAPEVIEEF